MQPKAFDLLVYLLRNRERVVEHAELLDNVWCGEVVSRGAVFSAVKKVREAVDDNGRSQKIIRTVPRRGFRFVAKTEEADDPGTPRRRVEARSEVPTLGNGAVSRRRDDSSLGPAELFDAPVVIVLPLESRASAMSRRFVSVGLSEEIAVELSRFEGIRVVAVQSGRLADEEGSLYELANKTRARFILRGSLRELDRAIHVRTVLEDFESRETLWSDEFECTQSTSSLLAAQQEIAQQVAGRVGDHHGVVFRRLHTDLSLQDATQYSSYEAVLRFHHDQLLHTEESLGAARQALESAVATEPRFGLGWAMLAEIEADDFGVRGATSPEVIAEAQRKAEKAVALAPACQQAHWAMAYAYFLSRNREGFLAAADRALNLNPNNPYLIGLIGWCRALMGQWEAGLELLERAIGLNPHCPGWFHLVPFLYHYRRCEYLEALGAAEQVDLPHLPLQWVIRAAALFRLDRGEGARAATERLISVCEQDPEIEVPQVLRALIYDEELCRQLAEDVLLAARL